MRPGVAWQGAKADLFEEAMRTVPAIARHRARKDSVMVNGSYLDFLRQAGEMGVSTSDAWAVLASAYSVWTQNLFELYAETTGVGTTDAIENAIHSVAAWSASRG